jgi:hypothetical protein
LKNQDFSVKWSSNGVRVGSGPIKS